MQANQQTGTSPPPPSPAVAFGSSFNQADRVAQAPTLEAHTEAAEQPMSMPMPQDQDMSMSNEDHSPLFDARRDSANMSGNAAMLARLSQHDTSGMRDDTSGGEPMATPKRDKMPGAPGRHVRLQEGGGWHTPSRYGWGNEEGGGDVE